MSETTKTEAFMGKMMGVYNGAMLALMVSIGHQTRLFDTMAGLPAATSEDIARASRLNERYVREWLGSMVTGGVVDYEPSTRTYHLPAEHAGALTRGAGPKNLAVLAPQFAMMAQVEAKIVDCFANGGGVPYSEYPHFHEFMSEFSGMGFDAGLVSALLPLAPGLVERLKAGIDVADVGCGAGHAINVMAKAFPNSRFTGFDFSNEAIDMGRAEAKAMGLGNSHFEVKDAATLDNSVQVDLITVFDAIHDQAKPARVLSGIYNALRAGGTFFCADVAASSNLEDNIDHPLGPCLYGVSTMHCMTVSLAYGGTGLGTMWGEQKAVEMIREAGFKDVAVKKIEGDLNNYYIAQK